MTNAAMAARRWGIRKKIVIWWWKLVLRGIIYCTWNSGRALHRWERPRAWRTMENCLRKLRRQTALTHSASHFGNVILRERWLHQRAQNTGYKNNFCNSNRKASQFSDVVIHTQPPNLNRNGTFVNILHPPLRGAITDHFAAFRNAMQN